MRGLVRFIGRTARAGFALLGLIVAAWSGWTYVRVTIERARERELRLAAAKRERHVRLVTVGGGGGA
jgi:hypothetical protein